MFKTLIDELSTNPSARARKNAAFELTLLGDVAGIPPLILALNDKSSQVRAWAADALGRLRAEEAVPFLIKLLGDKSGSVRGCAIQALASINASDTTIVAILSLLDDKVSRVRQAAAKALGELGAKVATAELIARTLDTDASVRLWSAYALGQIKEVQAVPALRDLLTDENSEVRAWAARALGQIKDVEAIEALLPLLTDRNASVREETAWSLGEIGTAPIAAPLIAAIGDAEMWVRRNVVWALGESKNVLALPALLNVINNDEENLNVYVPTLGAIAKVGGSQGFEVLAQEFEKGRSLYGVTWAMGFTKDKRGFDFLVKILQDKSVAAEVRAAAAASLGQLGDSRAYGLLMEMLEDNNKGLIRSAVSALGQLGVKEAIPLLIPLLDKQDADEEVRGNVAKALGELAATQAVIPLIKALSDSSSSVRSQAAYALGLIGDEKALPELTRVYQTDLATFEQGLVKDAAKIAINQIKSKM